jgi:hypothetical protein
MLTPKATEGLTIRLLRKNTTGSRWYRSSSTALSENQMSRMVSHRALTESNLNTCIGDIYPLPFSSIDSLSVECYQFHSLILHIYSVVRTSTQACNGFFAFFTLFLKTLLNRYIKTNIILLYYIESI